MSNRSTSANLAGPGVMLLSAALFGYFGIMTLFQEIDHTTGKLIPLVVTLKWTLRAAAIGFLVAAIASMAAPIPGNLLYGVVGVLSALMFVVIVVWDLNSTYTTGIHPFLLIVFAIWNGFSSFMQLRDMLLRRGARAAYDQSASS